MSSSGPSPRNIKKTEEAEAILQAWQVMDKYQKELDELNKKASKEILKVKTNYKKLRKAHYDKRSAVIDKIPNFWVNAIINHPQISMLVGKKEDCLRFLKKLEVEEFENVENEFRVKFVFDENPFFDNQELVKEFSLGPNTEPKSTSTGIKWKEQTDLSKKQPQIIDASRKRGLEQKTFFSWFSDNKDPAADDIAQLIKDDLWPNPLLYNHPPETEDGDKEALEIVAAVVQGEEDMMDEEDDYSAVDGRVELNTVKTRQKYGPKRKHRKGKGRNVKRKKESTSENVAGVGELVEEEALSPIHYDIQVTTPSRTPSSQGTRRSLRVATGSTPVVRENPEAPATKGDIKELKVGIESMEKTLGKILKVLERIENKIE